MSDQNPKIIVKNISETLKSSPSSSSKMLRPSTIGIYAAQCSECSKWRVISTQEEYEEIRSKFLEKPFVCKRQPGLSCEDPADMEYDATRTWVIDKPNLPKTPKNFDRSLVMRKDFSKLDAYYVTPSGKRLKSVSEVEVFIKSNPEYEGLSLSDFSFAVPKIMRDTIPDNIVQVKRTPAGGKSSSKKKIQA